MGYLRLLRQYVQVVLNEQHAELLTYRGWNIQTQTLSLWHSAWRAPADEENGIAAIPPIFALSFSKEKNLCSWALCGAVPLTRAPVHHRSVQRELSSELPQDQVTAESDFEVLLDYCNGGFDWTSHTLQQLQAVNHTACSWLCTRGYHGNSLKASINVQQRNLSERLARDAPNEECIQAIVKNGISQCTYLYYRPILPKYRQNVSIF